MSLKSRLLIICSAVALCVGSAIVPAAAENTTAHRESKEMRHHMKPHHKNMMMQRAKR